MQTTSGMLTEEKKNNFLEELGQNWLEEPYRMRENNGSILRRFVVEVEKIELNREKDFQRLF